MRRPAKPLFRDQAFRLREDAILNATAATLAAKGFDLMTMDDVAQAVGISKPVLYKHFKSKDELVAQAVIRRIDAAIGFLEKLPPEATAEYRLRRLLEWALQARLDGGLPLMPSTSAPLQQTLGLNAGYVARVQQLHGLLEQIVRQGKERGSLRRDLPDEVILCSYYARTCDPAVDFLRRFAKMDDASILAQLIDVFFQGVRGPR